MNANLHRRRLRALLTGDACVHPATVQDPISARIAEVAGYDLAVLPGSLASAAVLGVPDLIVLTLTEFAEQSRRVARYSGLAVIADADHGYGFYSDQPEVDAALHSALVQFFQRAL